MAGTQAQSETRLVAGPNDLLQLDHDAMQSHDLAIEGIHDAQHKQTSISFRGDHERHIQELTGPIVAHGGFPCKSRSGHVGNSAQDHGRCNVEGA